MEHESDPSTLFLDSVIASQFQPFWSSLVAHLTSPPVRKKTVILIGGLSGSGKTTLAGQLLTKLNSDPDLVRSLDDGLQIGTYYFWFRDGIELAENRKLLTFRSGAMSAEEYGLATRLMGDLLFVALSELPSPAVFIFDTILVTGAPDSTGEILGIDRGLRPALELAATVGAFCILVSASDPIRRKAADERSKSLSLSTLDLQAMLTTQNPLDSEENASLLHESLRKTADSLVIVQQEKELSDLIRLLIYKGLLPVPDADLFSVDPRSSEREKWIRYVQDVYYPWWLSATFQSGLFQDRGLIIHNDTVAQVGRRNLGAIKAFDLIGALERLAEREPSGYLLSILSAFGLTGRVA